MDWTGQQVVVTTDKRGVFFGTVESREGTTIFLRECRNCEYWNADVKGFIGLTVTGPNSGCRIGPATPGVCEILCVTGIWACSPEAVAAWRAEPWS